MASNIAIISAADSYTFFSDCGREGQALAGRLGGIVVWEDGTVEAVPTNLDDPRRPVYICGFGLAMAIERAMDALRKKTGASISA